MIKNGKALARRLLLAVWLLSAMALLQPVTLACGGCAFNYPWLHSFPDDDVLARATAGFFQEYAARQGAEFGGADYWYIKLERPGVEEQYKIVEVILCFKEEQGASYHYTTLAFNQEKGYFFWPHSMGSFDDREKLEAYLDSYVINRLAATEVMEAGQQGTAAPRRGPGNDLPLLPVAAVLGILLLKRRAGERSRARHR